MTSFEDFLDKKSINKAEVSKRREISPSRLSELTNNESTKLRARELYLISLAIDVKPCDVLKEIYGHLKIKI